MTKSIVHPYGWLMLMFIAEWYLISSFLCAGLICLALHDDTYGQELFRALNCGPNTLYETVRIMFTAPFILLLP